MIGAFSILNGVDSIEYDFILNGVDSVEYDFHSGKGLSRPKFRHLSRHFLISS